MTKGIIRSIVLASLLAPTSGLTASAGDLETNNIPPVDYKKSIDNIPGNWEEFWLDDETILGYMGEEVDEILMTKNTYGESGDGVQLAGGAWFTIISPNALLLKDETGVTKYVEFKHCRGLDRARFLFVQSDKAEIKFMRNRSLPLMSRQSGGWLEDCRIEAMHKWNGPTYYLGTIKRPKRNYRDMAKVRRDRGTRIGRYGH